LPSFAFDDDDDDDDDDEDEEAGDVTERVPPNYAEPKFRVMTTRSRSSVKLVAEIQRPEVSARMFRLRGKQSVTSGARARASVRIF